MLVIECGTSLLFLAVELSHSGCPCRFYCDIISMFYIESCVEIFPQLAACCQRRQTFFSLKIFESAVMLITLTPCSSYHVLMCSCYEKYEVLIAVGITMVSLLASYFVHFHRIAVFWAANFVD